MDAIRKAPELNYMTQIVFMLFEDVNKPDDSLDKYHVDIHFSPGIKGRRELASDGSRSLVKKSSPELPEKSPQVFVKRLSHSAIVGCPEGGASVAGIPAINRTKSAGENLNSGAVPTCTTTHSDFFRRYVTASRSTAGVISSSCTLSLSPKDRRSSAPNALRSLSDTRLMDKTSKMEEQLKEEEAENNGNGRPHRKKSASDSLLESMQELTFRIGDPSSHRSKSDGDVTGDESPKLRTSFKLAGSSPDLNRVHSTQPSEKQSQGNTTTKKPVKKLSAPSMTYRSVCKLILNPLYSLSPTCLPGQNNKSHPHHPPKTQRLMLCIMQVHVP